MIRLFINICIYTQLKIKALPYIFAYSWASYIHNLFVVLVIGRSIVIHAADAGAPRVACADIIPIGTATHVLEYQIPSPTGAFKYVTIIYNAHILICLWYDVVEMWHHYLK